MITLLYMSTSDCKRMYNFESATQMNGVTPACNSWKFKQGEQKKTNVHAEVSRFYEKIKRYFHKKRK